MLVDYSSGNDSSMCSLNMTLSQPFTESITCAAVVGGMEGIDGDILRLKIFVVLNCIRSTWQF